MKYEKPQILIAANAIGSILGTKPYGPYAEGMIFHTVSAYEADE
jgi:hypothetical protein